MNLGSRLGCLAGALLLGLVQCGGSDEAKRPNGSAGSGGSAGTAGSSSGGTAGKGRQEEPVGGGGAKAAEVDACLMPSADDYEAVWMPPRAVPGACSAEQISREYALCDFGSPEYDAEACRDFNTSKTNAVCLRCMFSAVGDDHSAAIVILPGNHWIANVGGCIALIDGDSSEASCGARTQASDFCRYSACIDVCTSSNSNAEWDACNDAAYVACKKYVGAAACTSLPRNARCRYATWAEYFKGTADFFCGSGPQGGEGGGGAGGATASIGGASEGGAAGSP